MRLPRRLGLVAAVLAVWVMAGCSDSGSGPDDSPGVAPATSMSAAPSPSPSPALTVVEPGDAMAAVRDGRLIRSITVDGGRLRLDPVTGAHGTAANTDRLTEAAELRQWIAVENPDWGTVLGPVVAVRARATISIPIEPGRGGVSGSPGPNFRSQDSWVVLWRTRFAYACPAIIIGQPTPSPPVLRWPLSDLGADLFSTDQPGLAAQYLAYRRICFGAPSSQASLISANPPIEGSPAQSSPITPTRYFDGSWHPLPVF